MLSKKLRRSLTWIFKELVAISHGKWKCQYLKDAHYQYRHSKLFPSTQSRLNRNSRQLTLADHFSALSLSSRTRHFVFGPLTAVISPGCLHKTHTTHHTAFSLTQSKHGAWPASRLTAGRMYLSNDAAIFPNVSRYLITAAGNDETAVMKSMHTYIHIHVKTPASCTWNSDNQWVSWSLTSLFSTNMAISETRITSEPTPSGLQQNFWRLHSSRPDAMPSIQPTLSKWKQSDRQCTVINSCTNQYAPTTFIFFLATLLQII